MTNPHAPSNASTGVRGGVLPYLATGIVAFELVWLFVYYWGVIRIGGDAWQTGDWLINYSSGLIRRGAAGELVASVLGQSQGLIGVFAVQMTLISVFVVSALILFWLSPRTPAWFALTLSPAFVLFPFLSFDGGLRKELIALSAAGIAALALRLSWHWVTWIPIVLLFGVGAFSHEIVSLTLPYFVFILWMGVRSHVWPRLTATWVGAGIALTAFAGIAVAVFASGTADQIEGICESWTSSGLWPDASRAQDFCSGAVSTLDDGVVRAIRQTAGMFPSYLSLVLPLALSALPFLIIRCPRPIRLLVVAQFVALLPLFVLAIDYGRWAFTLVALVSFACLGSVSTNCLDEYSLAPWLAVTFVSVWSLPYSGISISNSLVMQVLGSMYRWSSEWAAQFIGAG
ncbi:MAG: hypothetical protein O2789_04155 [Actinomycetota bacterium]|nr:hypothetical protein [Actinomycetota bacterium]